ncbi:MAG: outer membrane protein transport protein [Acidobacteria bacterium]|nr:outer membrane protein transport protein [Acidobacteriota bacterium]MBP8273123.1 outer membrane protein transport protein [Acidobacteriota bacterium]
MRKLLTWLLSLTLVLLSGQLTGLQASNGYFQLGTGTQSKGMGGAGVAILFGPAAPATNPAGIALGPGGLDLGAGLFNPNRDYEVTGAPSGFPGTFGLAPGKVESGSRAFAVPHAGVSRRTSRGAVGVLLYANGGMNTNYDAPTFGFAPTGVNLSQLFLAPTAAFRLNDRHAVGVSAVLAYQMFKADGLRAFSAFSSDPSNLTNNDTASSFGGGVRVGYQGRLSDYVSLGAAYQSRVFMTEFKKYAGLFAEEGDFDIPSNFTVGIGLHPTPNIDLAFDVQRMNYSEVKAVSNVMLPNLMTSPLGSDNGAGFGWKDMTVFKGGLQVRAGTDWTLRAGYAYGEQPIGEAEVLFNILAPGVIEQHVTAGFSRKVGRGSLDVSIIRALSKDMAGANPLEVPGRQRITLRMDQWDIGVGYTISFR